MISKELLSEVYKDGIRHIVDVEKSDNTSEIIITYLTLSEHKLIVNIYELAHKCKEWALSNGYFILSAVDGYLIVEDTKDNYKQVYRNSTSKEIPEYIAIFKACEWIEAQLKETT